MPGECPECGAEMAPDAPDAPDAPGWQTNAIPNAENLCPNCGIPYDTGDVFCLNCNLDFAAGTVKSFNEEAPSPPTALSADPGTSGLVAVLMVDLEPRADRPPDALPPTDRAEHRYPLHQDELIIGRLGDIVTSDAGCSRRHAKLIHLGNGEYGVQDIGTTNNTYVNERILSKSFDPGGAEIYALKAGDVIKIGFWTRITLESGPRSTSAFR